MRKVLILGPLKGKSQGKILGDYLKRRGYKAIAVTSKDTPAARGMEIVKIALKSKADIGIVLVFSGRSFIYTDIASMLLKLKRVPMIFWYHGGNLPEFKRSHKKWFERVIKRARLHVFPTDYLRIKLFGKDRGVKYRIIPNMLLEDSLIKKNFSDGITPSFLWLRAFHPMYDPLLALKIFGKIKKIFPKASLTMAGMDKGLKEACKDFIKHNRLKDIRLLDFVEGEEKKELFKTHTFFLHTSRIDNAPVSVIEGMAAGMIVIARAIGGLPFLIKDFENGLLYNSIDEAIEKIKKVLTYREVAEKIRENAFRTGLNSLPERVIPLWEEAFKDVLALQKIS